MSIRISVNLWSCHLIGGQGDDALYPGITDILYSTAHNQLDSLQNHNSVCNQQLEEEEKIRTANDVFKS